MIALLETAAALHALAPEWQDLWRRTPGATPFQSPAWLLPWWQQFGTGLPRVATLRGPEGLQAVLPMYVLDEPPIRKLLPVGAGTTDYLDILGGPADPLLAALLTRARADKVDRCELIEVPPWSALHACTPPPGWASAWRDDSPCPVLELPGATPPGTARKLRMNRNRAERQGGWTTEVAGPDTLPAMLAELVRLHQSRWTAQGETGALASPQVLSFHQHAAPALLAAGLLRLQVLRMGGAVAAAILALLSGPSRIMFYLSGFDAAHSFVSPGTILLGEMLDQAAREGRTEAHFLRGREAYKYAWGAVDRMNRACCFTPI